MTRRAPMSTNPGEEFKRVERVRVQLAGEFRRELYRLGEDPTGILGTKVQPDSVKCAVAYLKDWVDGKFGREE